MIDNNILKQMLENGVYAFGMYAYVRNDGDYAIHSYTQVQKDGKYIDYFLEDYAIGNLKDISDKKLEILIKETFYQAFNEFVSGKRENDTKNVVMEKMMKEDKKNKVKDSHYISIGYLHNKMHQHMKITDMQRDGNNWYSSKQVPGIVFKDGDTFADVAKEFKKILASNKR